MSAYGPPPSRPTDLPILPTQILELKAKDARASMTSGVVENETQEGSEKGYLAVYHLAEHNMPSELATYLYETFQAELEKGMTYPQEYPMTSSGFDVYFLGNDVFVGVLVKNTITVISNIEQARDGREWNACVGGTYYVKPNYPGRSSHTKMLPSSG
ncbi:hypothetical protein Clacol_002678 [Clathrus columnatus]|uniref:Uncharacterized protein n=1 Tax=Clathrus columnatus TaxID=1419009 RepID=A0AAV5A2I8_9AGAM|nr:hypothetical protein Clacol_002678 [Clathrus columnatus]